MISEGSCEASTRLRRPCFQALVRADSHKVVGEGHEGNLQSLQSLKFRLAKLLFLFRRQIRVKREGKRVGYRLSLCTDDYVPISNLQAGGGDPKASEQPVSFLGDRDRVLLHRRAGVVEPYPASKGVPLSVLSSWNAAAHSTLASFPRAVSSPRVLHPRGVGPLSARLFDDHVASDCLRRPAKEKAPPVTIAAIVGARTVPSNLRCSSVTRQPVATGAALSTGATPACCPTVSVSGSFIPAWQAGGHRYGIEACAKRLRVRSDRSVNRAEGEEDD